MSTPQDRGRQWEVDLARLVGGKRSVGSGNRSYAIADIGLGPIVIEAKHTDHESFRVTSDLLDDVCSQAFGPASASHATPMIALKMGERGRTLAIVELETQLDWLRAPPQIIQASPQDQLRATARTVSLLR